MPIGEYKEFATKFLRQQHDAILRGVPSVLIVSLPKSASAYVQTVLVRLFDIPWGRMSLTSPTPLKPPNDDWSPFAPARVVTTWASWIARGGATTHEHFAPLPDNLDALTKAGVRWTVASGAADPLAARFVGLNAQVAAGYAGVDWMKTVTIDAARILGISRSAGRLARGMAADLVVWSGDPNDPASIVERVYIGGKLAYQAPEAKGP